MSNKHHLHFLAHFAWVAALIGFAGCNPYYAPIDDAQPKNATDSKTGLQDFDKSQLANNQLMEIPDGFRAIVLPEVPRDKAGGGMVLPGMIFNVIEAVEFDGRNPTKFKTLVTGVNLFALVFEDSGNLTYAVLLRDSDARKVEKLFESGNIYVDWNIEYQVYDLDGLEKSGRLSYVGLTLNNSKAISAEHGVITNWSGRTQSIRIHILEDGTIQTNGFDGKRLVGESSMKKAVDTVPRRGNKISVLLTSESDGWETPVKRRVSTFLQQNDVRIYFVSGIH